MLAEHKLFSDPDPKIQNPSAICLVLIDFLLKTAEDFDIEGVHEIVRAADKLGVDLDIKKEYRLQIKQGDIEELKATCEEETGKPPVWKTLVSVLCTCQYERY